MIQYKELFVSKYRLNLSSEEEFREKFQEAISTLWANGEDEDVILSLKNFIKELYPKAKRGIDRIKNKDALYPPPHG